jgi:hypothetical protein
MRRMRKIGRRRGSISLFLNSLDEKSTDKCFVHLEIAVYSWIGSVAQATPEPWTRED